MQLNRKSKMVSFRLSQTEYHKLRAACGSHGVDSVSELARMAVSVLIASNPQSRAVDEQIVDLRERLRLLSMELDHLTRRVETSSVPTSFSHQNQSG